MKGENKRYRSERVPKSKGLNHIKVKVNNEKNCLLLNEKMSVKWSLVKSQQTFRLGNTLK